MRSRVFAATVALASMLPALGNTDGDVWTFQDCVEYARQHNLPLQQARLNEQSSAYAVEGAQAQWLPSVELNTSHAFTNSNWGSPDHNKFSGNAGINANWAIYSGGTRINNIKLAKKQREIDVLNVTDAERTLETELLAIYLNLLFAKEAIAIYEETVNLSDAQTSRAKELMDAGRISRVDYAQLRAQLEQDRYNLVSARSKYTSQRMELKKLLQLGIYDSITPATMDWTREELMAPLPPLAESYAMAVDRDPVLQSLVLKKEKADLTVAVAKSGHGPQLWLDAGIGTAYNTPVGANMGLDLRNGLNEHIGVSLTLPLLDRKKAKVAVAQAEIAKLDIDLETDNRLLELSQTVEGWYVDVSTSQSNYVAALERAEVAALSNSLVNERFVLGLVNPVEMLTAHNGLLTARHSVLQAKYMVVLGRKMIEFYRTSTVSLP